MDRSLLIHVTVLLGLTALAVTSAPAAEPDPARQKDLIHLVRQDCGSCHGMRLAGGLGPSLLPEKLADWPDESLVATILHGRPGTATRTPPRRPASPRALSSSGGFAALRVRDRPGAP